MSGTVPGWVRRPWFQRFLGLASETNSAARYFPPIPDRPAIDWNADPMEWFFFAGRSEELNRMTHWYWNRPEVSCLAVTGFYRAGKTSLSARFAQENRDQVIPLYLNFAFLNAPHEMRGVLRDLHRQIQEQVALVGGGGPSVDAVPDGNDGTALEETLGRFVRQAARQGQGVLVVLDDVDVLEPFPLVSLVNRLLLVNQRTVGVHRGAGHPADALRVLLLGQYRLYRYLANARSGWEHLPLNRRVGAADCVEYANRRLRFHRRKVPHFPFSARFGAWVVEWVGRAPQDLAGFLDLFFRDAVFAEPESNAVSDADAFLYHRIEETYYRMLADPVQPPELFEPFETLYLTDTENSTIARILDILTNSPEAGMAESDLLDACGAVPDAPRRLAELADFGFIERYRENGRWRIGLDKRLIADFLRVHFTHPLRQRNHDDEPNIFNSGTYGHDTRTVRTVHS